MLNEFQVSLINKETDEVLVSTTGISSSIKSGGTSPIPRVIEIKNTEDNKVMYEQLSKSEEGTFNLELEGEKVGKYNLLKGDNVIRLVEVL